jgi:acyl carrier protein
MTESNITSKLQEVFRSVFEDKSLEIKPETSAKDVANWDSMNHILLITEIESQFDVSFEMDDLIEMKSVGDIVAAILRKTA